MSEPSAAHPSETRPDLAGVAAVASLGAGAIHATAVGMHAEHRPAAIAFALVAAAQLAWGAWALTRHSRPIASIGASINLGAVAGWVVAKTTGIGFISGLEEAEAVGWADGLCAALGLFAGLAALRTVLASTTATAIGPIGSEPTEGDRRRRRLALNGLGGAVAVTALLGMVAASGDSHAGGHDAAAGGQGHGGTAAESGDHGDHPTTGTDDDAAAGGHEAAVVPPKEYDPTKPIDLGGVEGVTPEEQARAEALVTRTVEDLPQWADYRVAERAGYQSIGDAFTGEEHYILWDSIDDDTVLDPNEPESLVYRPDGKGGKTLAAAMYMLSPDVTLDTAPNIGGKLTQWHIHNDLCFTDDPVAPKVGGLADGQGNCRPPLKKFEPVSPMIHVWIVKHPCGPFAALEGVGGGQIKEGDTRLCDTAHGSGGT